jgi:ATP-dependent helicase/nuclease subunit B
LTEKKGAFHLDDVSFTLEAKPDRIDRAAEGAMIIDYKSGGSYALKAISNGDKPQLALEALILKKGGFADLGPLDSISLSYWLLTGGAEAGKVVEEISDIDDILDRTEQGLKSLITSFDNPETPYYSLPRPDRAPAYNDYEHLARVREWTVLGDNDTEAA